MKTIKKRIAIIITTLSVILSCALPEKSVMAAENTAVVNIPFGEDISDYDPAKDGYYGLLPVQYEKAQADDGLKTMAKVYMPVLVSDGHLYISDQEIQSVLGLAVKKGQSQLLISTFERNLALSCGNQEAQFFAGEIADTYISLTMQLSCQPIEYNDRIWVPFQDLCIIFDLGLHQEIDGENVFITVYDPDETVIDVLAYLYNHSSECKVEYISDHLSLLKAESATAQIASKLFDGDANAWAAVAMSAVGFDDEGYELILKEFVDDLTLDLMCVIPDESVTAAKEATNKISDVLSLIQTGYDIGSNAAVDMDLMDAVLEARVSSSSLVNDPHWFNEALNKLDTLTEQKKALQQFNTGFDYALTGLSTVFGFLQTAAVYATVDDISFGGVSGIVANKSYGSYSQAVVFDEMESYANLMQSGVIEYSLYDYVSKNWGKWVLDGLSASCPVFKLMQLASHLIPTIAEGINQTHSFQISQLAIPLQSDVENMLHAELKAYPARKADETEFKALSETAYIYLKTCYVARNQAIAALNTSQEVLASQQREMDFLLEKMAVLSVNYHIPPENTYAKYYRLLKIDDTVLIDHFVQKNYLQISGEVLKEEDESAVNDAHCDIFNSKGEKCGYFDGTPDGKYEGIFIPLYNPAGCRPYQEDLLLTASLRFSSSTVAGEDTVKVTEIPGAVVNPADPAYLGVKGVAIASTMGEIDGTLYSVSTQYINASAGIQTLNAPADTQNGYYLAKFAYYGGKIYYVEKTGGTDDSVQFRLCRCETDGSGREVLLDNEDLGWSSLYFVIENDVITWTQFHYQTGSTTYRTYSLSEGKIIDGKDVARPITELVLGQYDNDAVRIVENADHTWTLYRRLLNNEDEESLSENLVTIDDNGTASVAYQGVHGYISGVRSIYAIYNGYAYMTAYQNNEGLLYQLNLNDASDIQVIGRHIAAGGGDAFFNY